MYKHGIKRFFDILLSIIGLPLFFVVFVIVAPIIFLTDKGPVFYNANRLGYKGKIYKMYKFRSMRVNAPDLRNKDGSTYNGDDDPRVTKIGRILRKTSLDEAPQLLNVLKGDMSVVGPRPYVTTNYKGYETLTPLKKKRLEVRPGITGYSQAYFRNSISADEKDENDCYYVDHVSFLFDIKIFWQTAKSVLLRKNIYVSNEAQTDVHGSKNQ
jgi:lipopolysaccharide/colanic/teichoic acid biosynthesis glycosyltransferase